MAEYNVQINKYNANNLGYDQLYPQPMKHADTHLLNGSDPINVGELGVSNRNLLDNAYWANPDAIIDQRGGYVVPPGVKVYADKSLQIIGGETTAYRVVTERTSTYTAVRNSSGGESYVAPGSEVRGYVGAGYTIDRWITTNIVLTILDDSIKLTSASNYQNFVQVIDNAKHLAGKTVTISFLYKSTVSTSYCQFNINGTWTSYLQFVKSTEWNLAKLTYTFGSDLTRLIVGVSIMNNGDIEFQAAKLELGTVQTLAHQDEDGNWVLNDPPPDKGMELAKCQRYCFVWDYGNTSTSCLAVFQAHTATNAFGIIPTPVTLRANPVVSGGTLVAGGKTVSLTGITKCANGIRAIATVSDGNLTVGQAVGIENGNDNGRVVFSADL